ncbi:MAG: GNAT family N-acetyltransferase [Desulfobacterales bacterium]|nr:GNAT family N-acetyltransferase [Desulfobacterales bacterium]
MTSPVPLSKLHLLEDFDCGNIVLNEWLIRFAWQNNQANAAKTFVVCDELKVVGYYSLAVGSIEYNEVVPSRIKKGLAHHNIPVVILARLAVDLKYQKCGVGKGLLKDALLRTLNISEHIGIRAVFVNAKNDQARKFYQSNDFEPYPYDPLKLILLLSDIKKINSL